MAGFFSLDFICIYMLALFPYFFILPQFQAGKAVFA